MTLSCDLSDGGGRPETFIFLLVPGYSMMSLMSALEPLRSLNRLADRTAWPRPPLGRQAAVLGCRTMGWWLKQCRRFGLWRR